MPVKGLSIYSETTKKVAFNSTYHRFKNEMMKLFLLSVLIWIGFPPAAVLAKHEANFIMGTLNIQSKY